MATVTNPKPQYTTTESRPNASASERAMAATQVLLPVAAGVLAPNLDPSAAQAAGVAFVAGATFAGANYMNRLGAWANQLPGIAILRGHRDAIGISTVVTGMALGAGTLGGAETTDLLMAGVLDPVSVPGIVSLGWWAAVALVGVRLRKVFGRHTVYVNEHGPALPLNQGDPAPVSLADKIMAHWAMHISGERGPGRDQVLTDVVVYADHWTGRIIAPAGAAVNVSKEAISSAFRTAPAWITITHGDHAGEALLKVSYVQPAELDPKTLEGAWLNVRKRVLPKTHLEDVTADPNTGGQVAKIVADADLDALPRAVDLGQLAGALRSSVDLVSYEPRRNPREALIRIFDSNPLEAGQDFAGLAGLIATEGGWVNVGKIVSGYPARLQIFDPKLGALHIFIAGSTGSGKGGALQIVSLTYHANGIAQIYADPKGASNPALPKMAAYSGLGNIDSMGALRLSWWVLQHRIEEAARLELKNFQPSKMRPYCATILDEAAKRLGPKAPFRKEAVKIIGDGTSLGRSLGLPYALANQAVNLDQLGGEAHIRNNIMGGGTWIILRTDSDQVHLGDLPEEFKGLDPSLIPPVWAEEDDSMVYVEGMDESDPRRTFGLGYVAAAGGRPGMMRFTTLEDASPHIVPDQIAHPYDVPWWGDEAKMEELAQTPIPGFEEKGDGDDADSDEAGRILAGGVDLPKKERTAEEKVLDALRDESDPLYVDAIDKGDDVDPEEIDYVERGALLARSGVGESTFANVLNKLEKKGEIHRIKEGKVSKVALGQLPEEAGEEAA